MNYKTTKYFLVDLESNYSRDEIYHYYIELNNTAMQCVEHFNTSRKVFKRYCHKYGIKKPALLRNKNANRVRHTLSRDFRNRVDYDEFYNFYITENNSISACAAKFEANESSVVDYIHMHNLHKSVKKVLECSNATMLKRYGCAHSSQIEHVKVSKAKNVYKYKFGDETFDSSWELAFFIYNRDNGVDISRCYETFEYEYDSKIHHYTPDFKIGDKYIEIKGDYMWSANGLSHIYSGDSEQKLVAKSKCMSDLGVQVLLKGDIDVALTYCVDKFNDRHWYRKYRRGASNAK